ncbi:CDP-alcohol phosphatidyltransferase [Acinetobacter tandoii]|uniref:CDP-alcohol phosphatidyltransferase family protein n=1 Tax=Acinetobacter tandoii TaxID=202954 RepID=UPI000C20E9A1|nr:CDP-alcohol phosphatidyltransferase family protein [Acinetobacter tandoii]PJG44483.1 CDP-alcohol phosphatidyltransferase [Acinetobacter tandoii]
MPSIYQLKPAFQNLLRPLVRRLDQHGISANQVTLFAMFTSLIIAGALAYLFHTQPTAHATYFLLIPLWMLLRMAFNAIDGMLAREFQQQSKLGAYLNELCDVISDTALYLCFMVMSCISAPLLFMVVFLSILTEYAGVMAPVVGQERRYDGPMGKSDRAFWFSLLAIFYVLSQSFSEHLTFKLQQLMSNGLLAVILVLLFITLYNRIRNAI